MRLRVAWLRWGTAAFRQSTSRWHAGQAQDGTGMLRRPGRIMRRSRSHTHMACVASMRVPSAGALLDGAGPATGKDPQRDAGNGSMLATQGL